MHYMEDSREENAVNESLRNLHQMVTKVKQDGEVVLEYMKIYEREAMLIKQGRKCHSANYLEAFLSVYLETNSGSNSVMGILNYCCPAK